MFKGEHYDKWFLALETNAPKAQKIAHHELNKKYGNELFLIHQCVDSNIFVNTIE